MVSTLSRNKEGGQKIRDDAYLEQTPTALPNSQRGTSINSHEGRKVFSIRVFCKIKDLISLHEHIISQYTSLNV
jgi:hypothetical protein